MIENPQTPHSLKRVMTFRDLVVYGLAYIAPMGILSTLGFVWVESRGLIALAYLLGGFCMYLTAQSYAVMTEAVPSAGSVYGFARHSLGTSLGFVAGWMILLDYLLGPAFFYASVAVAVGTLVPGVDRAVWIVLLLAFTTGVNWFGVKVTTRVSFLAVLTQVVVMVAFAALILVALSRGFGRGGLTLAPFYLSGQLSFASLFAATSLCIMSFLGFDAVSTLAEETRSQDRRQVGRAIISVLFLSVAFFTLASWILGNALPGVRLDDPASAYFSLANAAIGPWAALSLAWAIVLAVGLSNALPMQAGVARVLFAMGRDRQLPVILSRVHHRHGTPYVGMLTSAVISLGVAVALRNNVDELASLVNFGALSGFLMLHLSVLVKFAYHERSRQWIRHCFVPIAGIAVVLAVLTGMSRLALDLGVAWLVVGIICAFILTMKTKLRA